jgi:type II secretory pathway pseudopilin PulG
MRRRPLPARDGRAGFTLVELLIAITLLMACVVGMGMSSLRFSRTVADTSLRARAQALADAQIAMARTWPTWATLESLADAQYNAPLEGLTRTTGVVADTTGGRAVKRLTVTVRSARAGALAPDVVRSITVAAP